MVGSKQAGVFLVMSLSISSSVLPIASWEEILAMANPVAFEARAELRDTRGFISITHWRPVFGSTANWMLQPPHSMPISRMILIESSRIFWYSRSVRV